MQEANSDALEESRSEPRGWQRSRPLRLGLLFAVAVLIAAVLLLRGEPMGDEGPTVPAPGVANRANVIIILVDTLRADHLGVYGYDYETSPFLDEWAKQAVVFENAYSPSSWTRPSMVALLSGLDPITHRVEDRLDVIPSGVRLLSERLRSSGYATFGFITNPHVSSDWAFDRGFDVFDDLDTVGRGTRADSVVDYVIERSDALVRSQPFFLYLHLIDPHSPYEPPPPFARRFPSDPENTSEFVIGGYDGEIAFVDSQLERLLTALRERGLEDGTMTVFTSDHGEELLDRGSIGHGHHLFEEALRVPLIIRLPGSEHAGLRVKERASLIDVVPTTLAVLGEPPPKDLDGRDLSQLLNLGRPAWKERELFLSLNTSGPDSHMMRGVMSGSRKYLRRSRPRASESLYDLELDPSELQNLAGGRTVLRERMAANLDAYLGRRSSGIHLRIVNAPAGDPADCGALLETTGRFVEISAVRLEEGDGVDLANDGRELRLRCRLENRLQPANAGSRLLPDEDGLSFQVQPRDAEIVVRDVTVASNPMLPLRAGSQEEIGAFPFTFVATAAPWSVRDIGEGMSHPRPVEGKTARAYLGVIPSPDRRETLSTELRDRLRALGYVTETDSPRDD